MAQRERHIVFLQFGDYHEAVQRFAKGGAENYSGQRKSVDFVARLAETHRVTVVSFMAELGLDAVVPSGVRCVGLGGEQAPRHRVLRTLEALAPTHLVLGTPHVGALLWALARVPHVLPLFADSFPAGGLKERVKHRVLSSALSHRKIQFVGNHNVPASLDLIRIGVAPDRVVPWDWPPKHRPSDHGARTLGEPPHRLFFVGGIFKEKGVPEIIRAVRALRRAGLDVSASIAGTGDDLDTMRKLAEDERVAEAVRFLGMVPNDEVPNLMRAHDVVVVPSRHEYPEGLPLTIYEALCSRTPLVISDHPMFVRALGRTPGTLVFRAGSPESLAERVREVLSNAARYAELSENSEQAWESIQVSLTYFEFIDFWLSGAKDARSKLSAHSLANRSSIPPTRVAEAALVTHDRQSTREIPLTEQRAS